MPIDPKVFKAVIITIFIALGAFVGYQLVTDDDANEAADTFEEMQREEDGGYYDEAEVAEFEAALGGDAGVGEYGEGIEFFNYFEHTAPGEYSEIFVEITGFAPNVQKIVYVRNADTGEYIEAGGQDLVTTDLGHISTRYRITSYGNYEVVAYGADGNEIVSPLITVE